MKQSMHHAPRTAKLIVALDVSRLAEARSFVDRLYPQVRIFKVGSQLFTAAGPAAVEFIRKRGGEAFLDLKFHDIPNTVANAVREAVRLKVKMLTLHICGGEEMLKAAVKAADQESLALGLRRPLLLGVTVLTSQKASAAKVLAAAKRGISCGLDGIICSAKEAALLRKHLGQKVVIVTPGIRPAGMQRQDQKRVASAQEAFAAGASFIVAGRSVLEAASPREAVRRLLG